jgi:serine/threonine-protein kinase
VPYIALELLDGRSLEVLRRERGGRLPVREALELVRGVLRALSAVHALGIVHRDLKPSNVFVTTAGELKVLDFGIAAANDGVSSGVDETAASTTRGILGTPAFMSPEQARGRWDRVDERSDLWAVGAMLFTLVSGEFVHVAGTENERLGLAMARPARSLDHVMPSAGLALSSVVARALAYEQGERFQSAAEFLGALSSLGEGEGDCSREPADVTVSDVSAVAREPRLRSALLASAAVFGVMSALALSPRSQASGAAAAAANPHAPTVATPARAVASTASSAEPAQSAKEDAPASVSTAPASASSVRQAPPPPAVRPPRRTVEKSEATNEQGPVKTAPAALPPGEDLLGVRTGTRATAHEPAPDPLERRD